MTAEFAPIAGKPLRLAEDLELVLAPNPSPMTHLGTNTYLLGRKSLVVIDPGPNAPSHLDALMKAIADRPVTHVLLTHSHVDHSPLAAQLAAVTRAPVCAFGDSLAGRSDVMVRLADEGFAGGGEGVDLLFCPDRTLEDAELLSGEWGQIRTIHTPGHMGNHLCFALGDVVFTGDLVMGWASSLISPPDGDLTDFMKSCRRLKRLNAKTFYPGHGAPVLDPNKRLDWLIAHRVERETQILTVLAQQSADPEQITANIYHDLAPGLRAAAERNVFAHLVDLHERGKVAATPRLSATATFTAT